MSAPTMRAVVLDGKKTVLAGLPLAPPEALEVRVRVELAGICRTDLLLAEGHLATPCSSLVLGHELSGVVAELGAQVQGLGVGDRVAVFPWVGCGSCALCRDGRPARCGQASMLGWHRPGAFAEFLTLPARAVFRVAAGLTPAEVALAEPIAAALAVLDAGLEPGQRGLITGASRFALLTERVLRSAGFDRIDRVSGPAQPDAYDFAIETAPSGALWAQLMDALVPGGTLVLKSRPAEPVPFDARVVVKKRLTVRGVDYGRFEDALALLEGRRLKLDDLLGPVYPLADFAAAFAAAAADDAQKCFLAP